MVKICKEYFPESEGFYMDGYMKSNLDIAREKSSLDGGNLISDILAYLKL